MTVFYVSGFPNLGEFPGVFQNICYPAVAEGADGFSK